MLGNSLCQLIQLIGLASQLLNILVSLVVAVAAVLEALATSLGACCGGIAAFGALVSAVAAMCAARATRDATRAELVVNLLDQYASTEMHEALAELKPWQEKSKQAIIEDFSRLETEDFARYADLDHAGRTVSHYYYKVATLFEEQYLQREDAEVVASKDQVRDYLRVIEPLEKAKNPDYSTHTFRTLARLWDIPYSPLAE